MEKASRSSHPMIVSNYDELKEHQSSYRGIVYCYRLLDIGLPILPHKARYALPPTPRLSHLDAPGVALRKRIFCCIVCARVYIYRARILLGYENAAKLDLNQLHPAPAPNRRFTWLRLNKSFVASLYQVHTDMVRTIPSIDQLNCTIGSRCSP